MACPCSSPSVPRKGAAGKRPPALLDRSPSPSPRAVLTHFKRQALTPTPSVPRLPVRLEVN